jgi:hypothetical protein
MEWDYTGILPHWGFDHCVVCVIVLWWKGMVKKEKHAEKSSGQFNIILDGLSLFWLRKY